jgi:hypothetical protein
MTSGSTDRAAASRVRPYAITGGRTRGTQDLPFETVIRTTADGRQALPRLVLERRRIVEMCVEPLSIAEISAHLCVPIGVARVIVGDMSAERLVATSQAAQPATDRPDIQLLEKVLDGLQAL